MFATQSVRNSLVEALELDLVGPGNGHLFARELLSEVPSRWYLTGFLVPTTAPIEQRTDVTAEDELDAAVDAEGTDDASPPERAAARRSFLPSSIGLSVLVAEPCESLQVTVAWGDYLFEGDDQEATEPPDDGPMEICAGADSYRVEKDAAARDGRRKGYRRVPREAAVTLALPARSGKPLVLEVPDSQGLKLVATIRPVGAQDVHRLPAGTRSVSVFLVNQRAPDVEHAYRGFAFQVALAISATAGALVARPDLRDGHDGAGASGEWDEKLADLQYRDVFEFGVGHGVSATAVVEGGVCSTVKTTWLPKAEVERVAAVHIPDVELGMEALGRLTDGEDAAAKLSPLVAHYRAWLKKQRQRVKGSGLEPGQLETADSLLKDAEYAATRIEAGIGLLRDPELLEAFRIANRAMAAAARRRDAIQKQQKADEVPAPAWRPFQLAFILMTLRSIAEPTHADRETVDLLFFPTGGGKTEAYLGLAAFTMVLRRLRNPGIRAAGMSVLMRYTLRLLTLDQLSRAAALMCALELEREKNKAKLGEWPFEIGLWVGSAATPNRMGFRGDDGPGADNTAYRKTQHFQQDERNPAPIPIENCPWCGTKFTRHAFRLAPNAAKPLDLRVHCVNRECEFAGDRWLPILGVDEPIYRRLPAFIIATVDKFAALPWTGETGTLFGLVERYDRDGFYGPCTPGRGTALGGPLPPPELVIQDELHLISGPLGTIAGVYETVIDALASQPAGDKQRIRPKIIASTATVRRAERQVRALFDRASVAMFPPPGPDRGDSFFAQTEPAEQSPARLYVGVAAQGRSAKVLLLRAALALLSSAQTAYEAAGGAKNPKNPADPYMTFLGYFNSLRELGGSRRIIEDEIRARVAQYSRRRRLEPEDTLFRNRDISYEVLELTSRVPTNQVAGAKRRLALPFQDREHVDAALATNMISVGLDILRLGLMVVNGQPKTSAEYIQATSRVGRDLHRPGLVVTLLNIHRHRDRSHYERFESYHASFYRAVEATSVTPFSPRALDRALAAVLVAFCRHRIPEMTAAGGAENILTLRQELDAVAVQIADRARNHDRELTVSAAQELRDHVLFRCRDLLDDWLKIAQKFQQSGTRLQYQKEAGGGSAQRLLYDFLDPELAGQAAIRKRFRANRSMRDVEPGVELEIKNLNDWSRGA